MKAIHIISCIVSGFAVRARSARIRLVFLQKWYTCQSPALALLNELQMLKELVQYNAIESKIAELTYKKFSGHLWYLSEMLSGLAFFDSRLSVEEMRKMGSALQKNGTYNPPRRIDVKKNCSSN